MPKAFLMNGKKRKPVEILFQNEDTNKDQSECDGQDCGSPKSFKYDPADSRSQRSPTNFSPSEASAFSKIDKTETEIHPQYDCPSKTLYHPGLFPTPFFPYAFAAFRQDNTSSNLTQTSAGSPNLYPSIAVPGNSESGEKSPASLAEKNMYYYVDPRIPFTNYFLNLTRLLSNNNASKACSAATPLSKVSEESRADERETTISPDSQKLSPGSISAGESRSVTSLDSSPVEKSFKEAVDKYHIPAYPDPHIPNPYTSLLHTAAQSSLLPLHNGGIFHPAMMQMSGAGFRRFNPEKPPPVKKYKCDVCGKAFSRSNTLVTHKRIHTGDKPFKCEICSRAFRQPGNLTRHRLTHTTVKPYICPTCHKAFNRASNLHTHMRTHTSFKAFVCPFCGKGFHQKIDMKIHCYTHTGRTDTTQI